MVAVSVPNLLQEFRSARAESDRLFSILKPEFLYHRPIAERHRVIFYLGHLDGFDSIQICREGLGISSPERALDDLFQAGIDPDSGHLPSDTEADWPSPAQVSAYAERCRSHVDRHLEHAADDVIYMALEHRLMHLETLAYMFHNFDYAMKDLRANLDRSFTGGPAGQAVESSWCEIQAGTATLGKPDDGEFGWDNEYSQTQYQVPAFRIQQHSVTNGEYLRFVNAGAPIPHFWIQRNGSFYLRGMFQEYPLPLDWPVYVSHQEANGYARSINKALPTEQQFHRAAYGTPHGSERSLPWGAAEPTEQHGNFDFRRWDPAPVTAYAAGNSAFGVSQMVGNGWQWTSSPFAPLPGFAARDTYPGYSANFFDGEHYVMKGAASRTAARLLRRSFRNWFRHDYPYMYATFRCVE